MKPAEVQRYIENPDDYFDVEEYFNIAGYFENELELDRVFEVLGKGIGNYPDELDLRLEEVRIAIIAGHFNKACKLLDRLPVLGFGNNPSDRLAIFVMTARLHAELGLYPSIKDDLDQYSDMLNGVDAEEAVSTTTIVANSYMQCFLYDDAIAALNKALELHPNETELLEDLIECHIKGNGDFATAIKVCERALDIDPYNTTFWHKLGYMHYYSHNMEEAIKAFDYATSIKEDKRDSWNAMGDCYFDNENFSKAADCFIKGTDYKDTDVQTLTKIGNTLNYAYRQNEAKNHFKMALDIDPDYAPALYGYGMASLMNHETNKSAVQSAIFWIKRAVTEDDGNALYWSTLGDCYFNIDCWGHCANAYLRTLNINSNQPDVLTKLGHTYISIGDYQEAIHCITKAKKINPEIYIANLYLAMAYHSLGDDTNAKYNLMQAIEADPDMGELFLKYDPDATDLVSEVMKLI